MDMIRIFDSDLNIAYGFIYQAYLSPSLMKTMILPFLIIVGIDFILKRKFDYQIISSKKSLIIIGSIYAAFPLIFILLVFFSDHRSDIFYTVLYGGIAYIFGLFTSCLYYLFVKKKFTHILLAESGYLYIICFYSFL